MFREPPMYSIFPMFSEPPMYSISSQCYSILLLTPCTLTVVYSRQLLLFGVPVETEALLKLPHRLRIWIDRS